MAQVSKLAKDFSQSWVTSSLALDALFLALTLGEFIATDMSTRQVRSSIVRLSLSASD